MARKKDEPVGSGNEGRERAPRLGPWRREVGSFLELFALSGIAVAQPTFDIFQKNADFLLSRRTTVFEAVAFATLLIVVPPVCLWVLEVLVGALLPRVRPWLHAAFGAALIGIFAVEILKKGTSLDPAILVVAGAFVGVVAGVALLRLGLVRTWARYLSPAPVVFALIFVFSSQVTPVIFVSDPSPVRVTIGRPSRVVMITFDEFPMESLLDGHGGIDAALFPNFARFAAGANWYRNTSTVAPNTVVAVPAVLTGDYPSGEKVPIASEYPHNLFTLLGDQYRMNVHESATRLCPVKMCGEQQAGVVVNDGLSGLLREGASQWWKFASPNRTSRQDILLHGSPSSPYATDPFRVFIASLGRGSRDQLDFLHVLMPHSPWHYVGTAQDYGFAGGPGRLAVWKDQWSATFGREQHLLQVQAADLMLGQVVHRLRRSGAYDDSLIVLTADHGVAFKAPGPSRGVSAANYPDVGWPPLLMKLPHQVQGKIDDRPARTIDILPTIADVLKTRVPWKIDGRSLLGPAQPDGPRRIATWVLNWLKPTNGQSYLQIDGPTGFRAAVAGRASSATGDPALRLYRVGPYGGLIGERASGRISSSAPTRAASIDGADRFSHVDPDARDIPWAYVHGSVAAGPNQPLAVTVNGTIAAVTQTSARGAKARGEFATLLPPQLMRKGRNDVRLFLVSGPVTAPVLESTRLGR